MASELMNGLMDASMKDTGREILCTARGSTRGLTVESMTASTKMIRKTEKVRFTGRTAACTVEAGDRVNSTAKPLLQHQVEKSVWASGKRVNESAGSMSLTLAKAPQLAK